MSTSTTRSTSTVRSKTPDWADETVSSLPPIALAAEVAALLRLSKRSLRRHTEQGRIRQLGDGIGSSAVRYARSDVAEYVRGLAR